ncbi:MAG: type III-B CRISPR module RAMP protein Cmr1 [Desulfamplus sp.]|nr:type III-B CRISPR module RAMP protein Cmr1 [Desulfamplus sp.]
MARKLAHNEPPPKFTLMENPDVIPLKYQIELITPMAGGGTRSWEANLKYPVRSQSIKGHLRFWWRTMQREISPNDLKEREKALWGGAGSGGGSDGRASSVKIQVKLIENVTIGNNRINYTDDTPDLPDYVLFPMRPLQTPKLLKSVRFELQLQVPDANREEVENSVKLWLLFGGLGARVSRGCGSLYCNEVMQDFQDADAIANYLQGLTPATHQNGVIPDFGKSPYPVIHNSRLAVSQPENNKSAQSIWSNFLSGFGDFRQKAGIGRNPGNGRRPGRTRWPEADAIRRITGQANYNHTPVHIAGNWFPRGAYGLPIQTEFKNASGDPYGKYFLQPEGGERWPSPVILKVIQLNPQVSIKICFILNHAVPANLRLMEDREELHTIFENEHPMAFHDKKMPPDQMLKSNENPYDALLRHFGFTEVI